MAKTLKKDITSIATWIIIILSLLAAIIYFVHIAESITSLDDSASYISRELSRTGTLSSAELSDVFDENQFTVVIQETGKPPITITKKTPQNIEIRNRTLFSMTVYENALNVPLLKLHGYDIGGCNGIR